MTILKARLGMTEVKSNYKNMFTDTCCRKCKLEEETLYHVLKCGSTRSNSEALIIEEAYGTIKNIENRDPSLVFSIANIIHEEIEELKNIKVLVLPLESEPMATSEEEDIE